MILYKHIAYKEPDRINNNRGEYDGKIFIKYDNKGIVQDKDHMMWAFLRRDHKQSFDYFHVGQHIKFNLSISMYRNYKNEKTEQGLCIPLILLSSFCCRLL